MLTKEDIDNQVEEYLDNCKEIENGECSWQVVDKAIKFGMKLVIDNINYFQYVNK